MRMDDREIRFWLNHPEWKIPYLDECGMDWDEIVRDYNERMEREKQLGIDNVRNAFAKILEKMTYEDFEKFEDGVLPPGMSSIIDVDPQTGAFVSKEYPEIVIGTIYDVFDAKEDYYSRMEAVAEAL